MCLAAPTVVGKGHHMIEPKAKHFSHCKKYQSSWQNQTDKLKRNTKISNHAYKNSEKIQIIFIDKLIINPQFIGSRQTHRKKVLHRIDLQEHRGEHGIENQRERRNHLATSYGPKGLWGLLMLHPKGKRVLHRIDLQEHRGELCIEIQRERRIHLANNYGPEGLR